MNIFVGSLPWDVDSDELRGFFEEYGEVDSAKIITDKFSGKSRGFGFVEMPDDEAAQKAIDELNGAEVDGRTIVVNKAEERRDRGGNRGGGGYRGGGGGGGGYRDRGGNRGGGGGYRDRDRGGYGDRY